MVLDLLRTIHCSLLTAHCSLLAVCDRVDTGTADRQAILGN